MSNSAASNNSGAGSRARSFLIPFILVTMLFFLWAFVHNLEPILIPHLKKACQLTDLESALIDSAVYIGYFLMAIPAGLFMKRFGYKKGILLGLGLYAAGALLFLPAADFRVYGFFLGALFIIASGCAFLETAANPYVTILGPPEGATTRLNFAQSFNGLGAFIAPVLGGRIILSGIEHTESELQSMSPDQLEAYLQMEADAVKMPYLIIALAVIAVAVLFIFTWMPEVPKETKSRKSSPAKALRRKHLAWGVVAQFFYVGAQVCVTSFFIRFARFTSDIAEKEAAMWLGGAMFGFMIGRFAGTFFTRFIPAHRLLALYSLICIVLLTIATLVRSEFAVWAVLAVPFFESIMFPTIFALAIKDLKEDTEIGSSLLVMAIAGGALFPLFMGLISDNINIQVAYVVPLICFLFVWYFGWRGYRVEPVANQSQSTT
ncbi:MAG TPA: L-fucose:H+ symporter permease [Cyclobacteriaceae bacterium]|nr:L-fucose:H+ symporter permease [Cyclobacteriaceae bacterium]